MLKSERPTKEENPSPKSGEMEMILSALANEDALKIFQAARDGIISSTKTIKGLGLTQKRYYSRLNQLMNAGLIEKNDNAYQHTMIGKICYKLGEAFNDALLHRDRLDLMDRLKKSKSISLEETKEIALAISGGSIGGLTQADLLSNVRIADTWEKCCRYAVEYLENAKESIYFATAYFEGRVAESCLRAAQRGVDMHFVTEKETISNKLQMLRIIISQPRTLKFFLEYLNSSNFKIRFSDIPYSFLVVDRKYAMIEVTNPFTNAFSMSFFFQDEKLGKRLMEIFKAMWRRGEEMKIPTISRIMKKTK